MSGLGTFLLFVNEYQKCSQALSIIGSLAGVSYFGPVAGHGFINHDLEMLREERKKFVNVTNGFTIEGPVEVLPAGEDADHFVRIHKKESITKETEEE